MCKLFGHKWFKDRHGEYIEDKFGNRIWAEEYFHTCSRCGARK